MAFHTATGQNHEGNLDKNTGGILNTGDIIPSMTGIPPVKNPGNPAQKSDIGDTGGIGDIFSTESRERE
ncbi:MAG TPA: hypothetical protein VKA91_09075 [Nitrososphaeraceae archaeon]|nr:hypothetical protein [Nitrososphaeraceae archaeon]